MSACDVCGLAMLARQRARHYSCCARTGGREPICNPSHKPHEDGTTGKWYRYCAVDGCWRRGVEVKVTKRTRKAAA